MPRWVVDVEEDGSIQLPAELATLLIDWGALAFVRHGDGFRLVPMEEVDVGGNSLVEAIALILTKLVELEGVRYV